MRRAGNQNRERERVVLDPVELDEQGVARRSGIVDRGEARDPGALLGLDHCPMGGRRVDASFVDRPGGGSPERRIVGQQRRREASAALAIERDGQLALPERS